MSIYNFIPNLFTSLNLAFGFLAIIQIFEGRLENVIYFTILSGVVDFFDGFFARLLKSASNLGKDLDSLADMASFGVVPALIMYKLLQMSAPGTYWPYFAVLIAVMSALRLAKFNHDDRQSDGFFGLPTPANAFFITSLAYLANDEVWWELMNSWAILVSITLSMSVLLMLDIPMMAFKFKTFRMKGNEAKYVFLIVSLIALTTLQLAALPFIVVLYILGSILDHLFSPKT